MRYYEISNVQVQVMFHLDLLIGKTWMSHQAAADNLRRCGCGLARNLGTGGNRCEKLDTLSWPWFQ